MKKFPTIAAFAVWTTLMVGSTSVLEARDLKAESGSPSGLTSVVLQVTARDLTGSDTSISLNTSQTLTRTALKLGAGKIDVGIVPPGAFAAMQRGVGPYKENSDQAKELAANLRSLYSFIGGSIHPIVGGDSGIDSWDDVKGKRIFIGPPGGAANRQLTGLVRAMTGYEPEVDYEAVKMGWGAAGQAFQDGQFDVYLAATAVGSASIVQLFLQGDYKFLTAPNRIIESAPYQEMLKSNGAISGGVPANAYEGVKNGDTDIDTYAYTMLTAVNKDMADDEAYLLTKTFWDNLEANKQEIAVLLTVKKLPFAGNNMLLHPGAIRYYKELGLEIPAEIITE